MEQRSATIAFLGNPHFDTRVNNLAASLETAGYSVNVIGFDWRNPEFRSEYSDRTICKISKNKFSIFFYIKFALLILKFLFKSNSDVYFAEDIYTLPFVYLAVRLKKRKLVYNSRELFGFLAGLRKKKLVQSLISKIEMFFITKVDLVLTTGEMDTEFIKDFYKIENVITIRNLPLYQTPNEKVDFRKKFDLCEDTKILFYQGVLFNGRGLAITIRSLKEMPDTVFILCGSGEQKNKFVELAEQNGVADRVYFMGAVDQAELINYTAGADLGLSLIENISKSYYYALPNKMFEYNMASVPVVVSDLPQMRKIVETYRNGEIIDIENRTSISEELNLLLNNKEKINSYRKNCEAAAKELNWQKEFEKLNKHLTELF